MSKQLAPLQVGFGIPAGVEHMVHRVRSFIEEEGEAIFHPFLALDLSNAFNAVDRGAILNAVRQKVQELGSTFSQLVGCTLDDTQWMDACTPIIEGGVGMSAPDEVADCAFTASFLNSARFWSYHGRRAFKLSEAECAVLGRLGAQLGPTSEPVAIVSRGSDMIDYFNIQPAISSQAWWVSRVAMKKRIASMNMRTPRDAIRISCLADTHSGDWLHATPSQKLGLWLQNTDFVRALRFRSLWRPCLVLHENRIH